jgi:hypothetical protein
MPGKVTRGTVVEVNLDPIIGHEISKTDLVLSFRTTSAMQHLTVQSSQQYREQSTIRNRSRFSLLYPRVKRD